VQISPARLESGVTRPAAKALGILRRALGPQITRPKSSDTQIAGGSCKDYCNRRFCVGQWNDSSLLVNQFSCRWEGCSDG
jgi:hypothetical protein